MSVVVTDRGFQPAVALNGQVLDIPAEDEADVTALAQLPQEVTIRVIFAAMGDGRGFTLARRLRLAGFAGRLRASGPLVSDQYAMARRVGFDEVEISDEHAERQPEAHWLARADWEAHDHQRLLMGGAG